MILVTIPVDDEARQRLKTYTFIGHIWHYPEVITHPLDMEYELESFFSRDFPNHEIVTMNELTLHFVRAYVKKHQVEARVRYLDALGDWEYTEIDSDGRCDYYHPCMQMYGKVLLDLL